MPSITEQILATLLLALAGTAPSVTRGRGDAIAEDELPAIVIRRVSTEQITDTFSADQVTTVFDLVIDTCHVAEIAAETAADALHVAAHALIKSDPQLIALGRSTLRCTGTDTDSKSADQYYHRLTAHYEVDAWVLQADLTTPA